MRINFFEEYPTPENMSKLGLVTWNCTVLVAASSMYEFEKIQQKYIMLYPHITFGWWPTVPGSYWISGLANPNDLNRIFNEILSKKQERELPILLDLELPHNKWLYVRNIFNLHKNKNKIKRFLQNAEKNNLKIYTAEYAAFSKLLLNVWRFFGISPDFGLSHIKLPMCYSSMLVQMSGKNIWQKVKTFEKKLAQSMQAG